jgi:hypothetical protein
MFNWYKKEKPFAGFAGFGGGSTGLGFSSRITASTYTIYLWGGAGANRTDSSYPEIMAGFTEVTIEKSSIPGSFTRFEVIVGQEGVNGNSTSTRFGGGGGGAPQSGTPGSGGSFVFLSSPGSTNVFSSPGTSIQVPTAEADSRCVASAGGMGGRDTIDNQGGSGGGGLLGGGQGGGVPGGQPGVDRRNSSPAYIGQNGIPGSPWSSGGGGGGFAGGIAGYDYSAYGGAGFAGQNLNNPQPFTGPSPVNGLEYTLGTTLGSASNGPYLISIPVDAAPYRPATAGRPVSSYPLSDARGYVVVINDDTGTATQFGYTGTIQYYNF